MTTDNEIQLYDTVEAIAAAYERRKAEIDRAASVAAACNVELKKDYPTEHKQNAWTEILDKSNARQWMSTKQESDVRRTLYDNPKDLPEITVETFRAWLQGLVTSSPEMLQELCREAFEILTPQKHAWGRDYKSNQDKREIPKSGRVVLTWMCDTDKWVTTPRLNYGAGQKLNVLDRVFSLLAKKPKPEGGQTAANLARAASERYKSEFTTFWGRCKMHKNGNLHIWLTDAKLVKKLANIAAGKNISERAA